MRSRSSRTLSLTGATGFVGWHLAGEFLREGWNVRAIVRPGNRKPVPSGASVVEADLTGSALERACEGSEALVHCAAVIRARSEEAFMSVNVEGTRAAVAAARGGGMKLVLISSQAAGGPGTPDSPRLEDDVPAPVNAYGRSKLASEAVVRAASGLSWTIVRPSAVFGPRDHGFLPLFRLGLRGLFVVPSRRDTWFTLVDVSDLARAVRLATEASAGGETFYVGHDRPRTGVDVLRAIADVLERPFRPRFAPAGVFAAAARLGDLSWAVGMKPPIDSGRLAELHSEGFVCSVAKARDRLGFVAQVTLEEGMARAARSYRDLGWI